MGYPMMPLWMNCWDCGSSHEPWEHGKTREEVEERKEELRQFELAEKEKYKGKTK